MKHHPPIYIRAARFKLNKIANSSWQPIFSNEQWEIRKNPQPDSGMYEEYYILDKEEKEGYHASVGKPINPRRIINDLHEVEADLKTSEFFFMNEDGLTAPADWISENLFDVLHNAPLPYTSPFKRTQYIISTDMAEGSFYGVIGEYKTQHPTLGSVVHNENGPARYYHGGGREWHLNGEFYHTKKDYELALRRLNAKA